MAECCRFCDTELEHVFVDLGMSPIANDYVPAERMNSMEPFYPLRVYVCHQCFLVQLPAVQSADAIFRDDYAYFSSMSDSWLAHAKAYVEGMIERFGFDQNHQVVELASNDGYLLQYFRERGVPVLGVEPCAQVAQSVEQGIENPRVGSSILSLGTNQFKDISGFCFLVPVSLGTFSVHLYRKWPWRPSRKHRRTPGRPSSANAAGR